MVLLYCIDKACAISPGSIVMQAVAGFLDKDIVISACWLNLRELGI